MEHITNQLLSRDHTEEAKAKGQSKGQVKGEGPEGWNIWK